jgi:NADH dehydrogenase
MTETRERKLHTVTGATGYTGRHITKLLLEQGDRVQSLTGHPERGNPFEGQVKLLPFDFDNPGELRKTLERTDTLFNTYWVRVNHRGRTHEQCVRQTKAMFNAAKEAGVRRIVHVSITNPDPGSGLPYFRGKAQVEEALRELEGVSHAILRPTLLFSQEDVLLNNIAWTMRKFPLVLMPGRGQYALQPIFVEDLARLAVAAAEDEDNTENDAVGPEIYSYQYLLRTVRGRTGAKCLILPAPRWLAYAAGRMLGALTGDIVITRDEIKGLSRELLVSRAGTPPLGHTKLSEWLDRHGQELGRSYASETERHYR